jgi:hypothetical protein
MWGALDGGIPLCAYLMGEAARSRRRDSGDISSTPRKAFTESSSRPWMSIRASGLCLAPTYDTRWSGRVRTIP